MTADTGAWIVFNGEIYNHRALRVELASHGHRFRTTSDTEVILHAYQKYGLACVEHLHGMFAFAIYDPAKAELFIARDRLGKKPLFYAILDGVLHFASEIKALYESPAWDGTIDDSTLEVVELNATAALPPQRVSLSSKAGSYRSSRIQRLLRRGGP